LTDVSKKENTVGKNIDYSTNSVKKYGFKKLHLPKKPVTNAS
jgi:hypothetical protein